MLLESAQGERLWTTLTFVKPISLHAMRTLLQEAQVEAVSYTQVGWTTTGERMGSTIFASDNPDFDVEKATKEAISQDPNASDYKAQMAGFMMVDGYLTVSQESLGQLLRDNRLYIIDTTIGDRLRYCNKSQMGKGARSSLGIFLRCALTTPKSRFS